MFARVSATPPSTPVRLAQSLRRPGGVPPPLDHVTEQLHSIAFEQPLNERMRTLLRLEFLFSQHAHHARDTTSFGLRARLGALLDLLTVMSRSDLKKEIVKELQEQQEALRRMESRPGVDSARLSEVLAELRSVVSRLQPTLTQFSGSALRENEFLISVYNRISIPGGSCGFDLPAYHYWLSQPVEMAQADLDAWFSLVAPFADGVALYLRLLRGSVEPLSAVAQDGVYVHQPQGPCTLLRVLLPRSAGVYPEISAGAHRFTIRFMSFPGARQRTAQAQGALPFQLQCCVL